MQVTESFTSFSANGEWNPPKTYAYNEYGQEIAVGIDVTDLFAVSEQVEVIGEITLSQKSCDDDDDHNEGCHDPTRVNADSKNEGGLLKKRKSSVIKNYTSTKTKEAKRLKTLLEKKIEMQQKKERSVLSVIYCCITPSSWETLSSKASSPVS